jgi:hypothetical protein
MNEFEPWFNRLAGIPDMPNVHNLFSNRTPDGSIRLNNLKRYFAQILAFNPEILLVGEAPGYQGTYRTGVPFCSEAVLLGPKNKFGLFGGPENGYYRVYKDEGKTWKEPSATIVQRTINELDTPPLIWATFPLHPYRSNIDLSNRAPNTSEIQLGGELLDELITIMQPKLVIAAGNVANKCLLSLGVDAKKVRHPSHGGANLFHDQLLEILEN